MFAVVAARSQPYKYSNLRNKKIVASSSIIIDTVSIVPRTFFIKGYDTSYYSIDDVNAILTWKKSLPTDSIQIFYRVFPYRLNAIKKRFTYDSVMNNFIAQQKVLNTKHEGENSLFDFGTMNYNGSFGRALSFGNSQDVVVNSQFNLQLNGLLGDSIQLAAAITDNNIPIQPDGTTQQLNEFDRVWLQFKKKGWEVNLGDIDLRQNQSYYLNFYKRLQGISYSNVSRLGKNGSNKIQTTGAIAKGKFTRNVFQGEEGNQGPYRLKGVNNEIFFIVLAGTERVFIDGQLMQRGEDQDYVINYNTAEIAFTPRRMITKDSRIQVEFEYAERSFLNSMLYASDELTVNKKLAINIAAYSNADAKNSPVNQQLDTKQKQFLNNIGDSIQNAFYPTATPDTFSTTKILYAQIDTFDDRGSQKIYVYSTNKDSAKYSLGFIEVGQGKGNYVPDFNGANGKVFRWVAPVNGLPQGNFEPATYLVTPKKQQVVTIGAVYAINEKTNLSTEVAMSNYDVNAFSAKDKGDNKGFAGKMNIDHLIHLYTHTGKVLLLKTVGGYEVTDQNFHPVERLRTVEFYRDWGLEFQPGAATEHLPFAEFQLSDSAGNSLQYQSSAYIRSDGYKGLRQLISHEQKIKGWQLRNIFNLTNFHSQYNKGFFLRPSVDVSKVFHQLNNYVLGATYSLEHNEIHDKLSDTVSSSSFAFTTVSAYIRSNQARNNHWSLTYFTRNDQIPYFKKLERVDRSQNITLNTELLSNSHHQLRLNVTYRQLQVTNKTLSNLKPENTILGRAEYAINEFKGFITGNALYEVGAGQEQRRDFIYLEVPPGRGEYAWNDYNKDGIPQLNEFEIALFPDQAKFIRVFTPTNEFVKANYTQFNYSITLNPKTLSNKFRNKKFGNFIGRINLQSSLQTAKKELSKGDIVFNPFKKISLNDTALLTLTNVFTNTFSFNRFSTKWGFDISNGTNYNKSLLTYGFESRKLNDWTLKGRWNPLRNYTFELIQKITNNSLFTPKFNNRNYEIETINSEPRLTFTSGTSYRLSTSYEFSQKKNKLIYGGEKSTSNSLNVEGKYNAVNNTSLTGKLTYANISYTGTPNTTVSYIMLDALMPGKNMLWNFDLTKRLGNNLELTFQYEGRKPAETRTIHIGRASLRAIL
ncbi:hypothetical protein [Segetibacter koreensis]|uniref:hypothetical protein n=1 Tax=Segetibacter koreensis TaxID=398037 RepID=UPI0003608AE6|nr:hypothetical protein [Segetibacter koreensis]